MANAAIRVCPARVTCTAVPPTQSKFVNSAGAAPTSAKSSATRKRVCWHGSGGDSVIDDPVRIVEADVQPFCLRLSRPWQSARGVLHRREGWLIRLVDAEGISGVGECGPMPEAGTESAARAGGGLGEWSSRLPGRTVAQAWEDLESDGPGPAARCALGRPARSASACSP